VTPQAFGRAALLTLITGVSAVVAPGLTESPALPAGALLVIVGGLMCCLQRGLAQRDDALISEKRVEDLRAELERLVGRQEADLKELRERFNKAATQGVLRA